MWPAWNTRSEFLISNCFVGFEIMKRDITSYGPFENQLNVTGEYVDSIFRVEE
jgi:hypothetical protein